MPPSGPSAPSSRPDPMHESGAPSSPVLGGHTARTLIIGAVVLIAVVIAMVIATRGMQRDVPKVNAPDTPMYSPSPSESRPAAPRP